MEDVHIQRDAMAPLFEYIHRLARCVIGEAIPNSENSGFRRWVAGAVDHIEIMHSAIAIWRKNESPWTEKDIDQIQELVAKSGSAVGWDGLATALIARHETDRAERALREAIRLNPTHKGLQERMAILLATKGDFKGAIEALEAMIVASTDPNRTKALRARQDTYRVRNNAAALHAEPLTAE